MSVGQIGYIQLTPNEDALDGRQLDMLIELWLGDCANRLDANETMPGYRRSVSYFRRWWYDEGPGRNWLLTKTACEQFEIDLRSVVSKLSGQPLSYSSRYDCIRRMRQMFHWAHRTSRVSHNYGLWFPTPDGAPPSREAASLAKLELLMAVAATSPLPLRNQAILALLIGAGLRRKECHLLDVEHLTFYSDGTGKAIVTGKRTRRNPTGVRSVALDASTCAYLAAHLVELDGAGPVFRNAHTKKRLTCLGVYKVVKWVIAAAGLEGEIEGCHDLRRAFAHHFATLRPGATYADMLRRQLGHAHYSQTADYTLLGVDDLRAHIISPLALFGKDSQETASIGPFPGP